VHFYGGYRLRAIYYEVFEDVVADYLRGGGYRLLHDFSGRAGTGFLGPACRPRMLRLTRAELPPGAMSMATQMFDPPAPDSGSRRPNSASRCAPRWRFRPVDCDKLGLSTETVRSNWRGIYHRLAALLPVTDAPQRSGNGAIRGLEKRRVAVDYLRQNLHELRPVERTTRGR